MVTQIRDGSPEDSDAIVQVHNAAWRRTYRNLFPDDYLDSDDLVERQRGDWQRFFAADKPEGPLRVACADDALIGFATWKIEDDSTVQLTGLYVAPMHWSTGVGSALQRDARDSWRAAEFKNAFLWSAVDNPRAHRSYKKNGWVISEESKEQEVDGYKVPIHKLTLEL